MIGELTNHLWQSTIFAFVVALLNAALRENRAHVRYWLWFAASLKFFLPFSLLASVGSQLRWTPTESEITGPATRKIGRASCRERVKIEVGGVSLKEKEEVKKEAREGDTGT